MHPLLQLQVAGPNPSIESPPECAQFLRSPLQKKTPPISRMPFVKARESRGVVGNGPAERRMNSYSSPLPVSTVPPLGGSLRCRLVSCRPGALATAAVTVTI